MGLAHRVVGGLALSLVLLGAAAPSGADIPGSGTYDIFQGGSRVGSERFTWSEAEGGQGSLEGECILDVGGVSTTLRPVLIVDAGTMAPRRYTREFAQGDRVDLVEAVLDGGKVVLSVRENGSSGKRTLKIKPAALVVDDHVMSLLPLVVRHYDFEAGGQQELIVFDTTAGKAHTAHAMVRGMGTFENPSGTYRLKRLTINLENVAVDLLVDDDGRVPLISIPMRNIEARLANYSSQAKAEVIGAR